MAKKQGKIAVPETEPIEIKVNYPALSTIPEWAALALTFLLPLKFATTVGVPEISGIYWADPIGLVIGAWPIHTFPVFAAFALGLTLLFTRGVPFRNNIIRLYAILWAVLSAVSLLGFINASTWDFAAHISLYCFGAGAYAMNLCLLLERRPEFSRMLLWAVIAGGLCSAWSGLNQYFTGFENTRDFIYQQELKSGEKIITGQFAIRLSESRVSADFTICNTYAGYLAAVFPVIIAMFWTLGGKVTPPLLSRIILSVPFAALFLFLLKETGSRGGILAIGSGLIIVALVLKMPKKLRIMSLAAIPIMIAAFITMVKMGRGFKSMEFRFDYFDAAMRMMFREPLTGVGWGDFFHEYTWTKHLVNTESPHSPHNFILSLGSQCGVPGFIIASAVILLPVGAGLFILYRAFRQEKMDFEDIALKTALNIGIVAWTVDSLLEINFETPGSTCTAIALSLILMSSPEFRIFNIRRIEDSCGITAKRWRIGWLVFIAVSVCLMLRIFICAPQIINGEFAYEQLQNATDIRFSTVEKRKDTTPLKVHDLLNECIRIIPRSPFPYDNASDYMARLGYFGDAMLLLDEAIARSPERSAYYYRKYRMLSAMYGSGNASAQENLNKARQLFPGNPEYYDNGEVPEETVLRIIGK